MTGSCLVDANVLIAARLARDQNHDRATVLTDAFDTGELPTGVVTDGVLAEVMNYLTARATHTVAVETIDALVESNGFEVVFTPKRDFDTGRSVFRTFEELSLTDARIVATMRRLDAEYLYTFDDGFDAVDDITRLTTPEHPSNS